LESPVKLISKYKPLFTSDTRYFILSGGRGSAKSFHVADFLLKLSYEAGHSILFTRYTMISAHLSVIPEFTDKIERYGVSDAFSVTNTEIVNNLSGSRIIFKGIKTSSGNQTAALKSLQGITTFLVEEAEELVDEDVFDKIDESVRVQDVQNRVIIILNPTTKAHWIYKRFFESKGVQEGFNGVKGDTTYIHTTYLDNKENLNESIVRKFDELKITHPNKYQHRVMGGWLDKAEGVIFDNWKLGKFKEDGVVVYGMDFGYSVDPTALVKTYIDSKRRKIYVKLLIYKPNLTTSDIYELAAPKVGDGLIIADSAEPRLIAELKARGLNIKPAKKGPDSVKGGIAQLLDYELIIDPESTEIVKELNNYCWLSKGDKPIDDYNHTLDSLRYAVSFQIDDPNKGSYAII
jgi:phage terminase large subunit